MGRRVVLDTKPFISICQEDRPCTFSRYCGNKARWNYRVEVYAYNKPNYLLTRHVCDHHLRARLAQRGVTPVDRDGDAGFNPKRPRA